MSPVVQSIIVVTVSAAGVLASASGCLAQSRERPGAALGLHWTVETVFLPDVATAVEHVPLKLRQLPSHPGDSWIYGSRQVVRTIPFDSIEPNPVSTMTVVRIGFEAAAGRVRFRAGPSLAFLPRIDRGLVKANAGATRLVNQFGGSARGGGTSLVYYNMYPTMSRTPGWFGEVSVDASRYVAAFGGLGYDNVRLLTESGYDRFDRFEIYDQGTAGTVRVAGAYGGLLVRAPLGANHSIGARLTVGRVGEPLTAGEMAVHTSGRWYAAVGLSVQHALKVRP